MPVSCGPGMPGPYRAAYSMAIYFSHAPSLPYSCGYRIKLRLYRLVFCDRCASSVSLHPPQARSTPSPRSRHSHSQTGRRSSPARGQGAGDLHHQGALHPLAEHLAAVLISAVDVAGSVQGVGRAAARAVQACPAVLAVGAGIDVAQLELVAQGGVGHASQTLPSLYAGSPTNWWQGYRSPQGVTAMYSVPEPQPEMRL